MILIMAITALRKELSVAANSLHCLNLIYLINMITYESTPLHAKAFSPANEQINKGRETDPCVLSDADNS